MHIKNLVKTGFNSKNNVIMAADQTEKCSYVCVMKSVGTA